MSAHLAHHLGVMCIVNAAACKAEGVTPDEKHSCVVFVPKALDCGGQMPWAACLLGKAWCISFGKTQFNDMCKGAAYVFT